MYSWKLLYLYSFCSVSYSLSKEIGDGVRVRGKDPNKMEHRDTVMFIVCTQHFIWYCVSFKFC